VLLVIRDASRKGPDRLVRNGDAIYLNAQPPRAPEAVSTWIVDGPELKGQQLQAGAELADGVSLLLRSIDGSGYLLARPAGDGTSVPVAVRDGTRFVIYKADNPDPSRPTTCDALLRDGDFVFVRAVTPDAWISVGATGIPYRQSAASTQDVARVRRGEDPGCLKDEQRCYTDQDGGLVCAWAPSCSGSP
jgi:hypothetical protein